MPFLKSTFVPTTRPSITICMDTFFFSRKCISYHIFICNDPLTFKIFLYYARLLSTLNSQCVPFICRPYERAFLSVDQTDEIQKKDPSVMIYILRINSGTNLDGGDRGERPSGSRRGLHFLT